MTSRNWLTGTKLQTFVCEYTQKGEYWQCYKQPNVKRDQAGKLP